MNYQHEVLSAVNVIEEYWNDVECKSPRALKSRIPVKLWQTALACDRRRYESEVVVFAESECVGTIDLLDVKSGIAFQLRVFGEAPEKEFYEEIFKVVIYNRGARKKIKKLVFITRTKSAEELNKGLGKAVCLHCGAFGFEVEVIGVGGDSFE